MSPAVLGETADAGDREAAASPGQQPKPVIFSVGAVFPIQASSESGLAVEFERDWSFGATGQIPLASHCRLGAFFDYNRMKPLTSLFVWGGELVGSQKITGALRLEGSAGVGYSILHGSLQSFDEGQGMLRFLARIVFQKRGKIGCAVEAVYWNNGGTLLGDFSGLRIGVVF
ncbi:MAG: hypothetical protein NTW07_01100 [candidate division Zixibacteria bacterium]|nr:hypothetical protein [candidate division Zixibacteria bacterium]